MDSKTKDVVEDLRSHTTKFSYMHNPGQNEKASVSLSKELKRGHVHKCMQAEDSDFLKCLNAEYTSILDDPKPEFSIDCGDDPSYALANEKTGLTKPLKYMETDPNGEEENDLESHAKAEGIEFQSNYDCDYNCSLKKDDNVVSKKQKYTNAIQLETTSKGEITERRPQHKHRDLRFGGSKFYPSDKMGKSLLDHHLVLKRKIEEAVAANNDLKQLNLLRGFFFWLQLYTKQGIFLTSYLWSFVDVSFNKKFQASNTVPITSSTL
ncbi:hypothetical protein M9H77_11519 [Catharanthus roseus]|uniref:Uncharacterized protein n=1 Tax=Catharanthus roseus TaxID=4058 RepID=A0ACC0BEV4_CATRO|nr:hypothetical protein M9H77_11519 [Catharanthus roseus]